MPVGHVTNGVHVPSWDSAEADRLWTAACGKERWRCAVDMMSDQVAGLVDAELWAMQGCRPASSRPQCAPAAEQQLGARGEPPEVIAAAEQVLDPDILTLGFARRFTGYKRPNLLLHDVDRLHRLLTNPAQPAQLIFAGKAHPADEEGTRMIQEWILLEREPELRRRLVFLEDYDLALAQELVQGVDVWINTPRRPWEACGTSGMKVLVNGGLNLSVLDGWWEEAYEPEVGWAVGDGETLEPSVRDSRDAGTLYELLENDIVPEFYARDETGIPRAWLARIRHSLSRLTPAYSSNRMLHEYIEQLYLPAASEFRRRTGGNVPMATGMHECGNAGCGCGWPQLHIGASTVTAADGVWNFSVPIYLGDLGTDDLRVELYMPSRKSTDHLRSARWRACSSIPGTANSHIYVGAASATRPAEHYTVRITSAGTGVSSIPAELNLILWQK